MKTSGFHLSGVFFFFFLFPFPFSLLPSTFENSLQEFDQKGGRLRPCIAQVEALRTTFIMPEIKDFANSHRIIYSIVAAVKSHTLFMMSFSIQRTNESSIDLI
jgi:hypothetical protein